ncbi:RNA-metabolising metallo-beta-lactamase family protein [Zea mays]|uniref:RNA-metabolising metallo-beta-lactamase family protein n=3 Tax=Zea mays TaxID=4577 RepID=A0A1D6MR20_MAIZE|nr:RNA-metabolising metallo-beta-lactamase family protein [Zea mays]
MLGVSHLRNRRLLSNGFVSLGKEDLQLMYSDGDKAFGTSTDLCIDERLRIASDGIIFVSHMERMVAEILRKMVRKYSGKRPDIIAVAMENTTASFSEHLDAKSSGNFEPSSATSHLSRSPAMSLEGSYKTHPDNLEVDAKETLPEATRTAPDDATTSSNGEAFFSSDLHQPKTLEYLWESFKSPTAVKIARIVNGGKKHNLGKIGIMGKDSAIQSAPAPAKSSKKNKWKPEEIKSLIQMRGEMNGRFQSVKGRMVLWEEIFDNMLKQGISRTLAQCKSLWTSLV